MVFTRWVEVRRHGGGRGNNDYGQLNVGSWSSIVQVAAGDDHTVGLKSDGTVVAVGDNVTVS